MSETCTCGVCQECVDREQLAISESIPKAHIQLRSGDFYKQLRRLGTYQANLENDYLDKAIDAANLGFRLYVDRPDMDLRAKLVYSETMMLLLRDLLNYHRVPRATELVPTSEIEAFTKQLQERRKSGHKHKGTSSKGKDKKLKLDGPPVANPRDLLYKTSDPKEREIVKMIIKMREGKVPWQSLIPTIKLTNPTVDVDGLIKKIGLG